MSNSLFYNNFLLSETAPGSTAAEAPATAAAKAASSAAPATTAATSPAAEIAAASMASSRRVTSILERLIEDIDKENYYK